MEVKNENLIPIDTSNLAIAEDLKNLEKEQEEEIEKIKLLFKNEIRIFDKIMKDFTDDFGKAVSRKEREDFHLYSQNLVYGEIKFESFAHTLYLLKSKYKAIPPKATFIDLGSGTGKACFVAALILDLKKVIGVEILKGLYEVSDLALKQFNLLYQVGEIQETDMEFQFVHGDLMKYQWSTFDIVFINSTCFSEELMESISKEASKMKPHSIVVTFTWGLENLDFLVLETRTYKTSWGSATVIIHQRKESLLPNESVF